MPGLHSLARELGVGKDTVEASMRIQGGVEMVCYKRIADDGDVRAAARAADCRRRAELGHRRVVLITRPTRLLPEPGASERAFLAGLDEAGLKTGPYNLPVWEETRPGLQRLLSPLFAAVQHFVTRRGLRVPEDVSLASTDPSPDFGWQEPSVTHIRWDHRPVVRRIVHWADHVAHGKNDRLQTLTKTELVEGGTVGPVR